MIPQDTLNIIEQEAKELFDIWRTTGNVGVYDTTLNALKRGYELAMEKMGNHPNSIQYMALVEKNKELQKEINELDEEIRNRTPYNL